MNYSPELKDALLRRMFPPNNESITKNFQRRRYFRTDICVTGGTKPERKAMPLLVQMPSQTIGAHRINS